MFLVSLENLKDWHDIEKNRVIVEADELSTVHDLGTYVVDGDVVIANINVDAINDPEVSYQAGIIVGQKMAYDALARFLSTQQVHTTEQ